MYKNLKKEKFIFLYICGFVFFISQLSTEVLAQESSGSNDKYEKERFKMVEEQIRKRDIEQSSVLEAMRNVPRHLFVPEVYQNQAYMAYPLPIGFGQTISQPLVVAYMTEAANLSGDEKVLEIGTGSGYQAAVLGEIAREVYTIEIIPELAEKAGNILQELHYTNIFVKQGNGYLGWPEHAPFDAIVVTAAPDEIPQTLIDQLAIGGKMVIPVGTTKQELIIIEKTKEGIIKKRTLPVRFVPMTGKPSQ